MTSDELEELLQGQSETQGLDFKGPCEWVVARLAKDILAFSNVRDGGRLIIGIEDGTYARKGVTPEQAATFNVETMRDQMAAFADPHVNFSVEFPRDAAGLQYVVIRVNPFVEIPVICQRDSDHTTKGTIYYRNRNRRVESAAISNSYDMRDVIERATVLMMQRMNGLGLRVAPGAAAKFDDELEGL